MISKTLALRLLPFVYFLGVSFPHHYVSDLLEKYLLIPFGMDAVQAGANCATVVPLSVLVLVVGRIVYVQRARSKQFLFACVVALALIWIADRDLLVNNIERIHYVQYALLVTLLAFSLRDEVLIFLLSCFAGFIDELQQFVLKPSHTNYFDFNDIVFNILGAMLGIFIVQSLFSRGERSPTAYDRKVRLAFAGTVAALAFAVILAASTGRITPYADVSRPERQVFASVNGKMSFILSFEKSESFWTVADNKKEFHTLNPYEGLLAVATLLTLGWCGVRFLRRSSRVDPYSQHFLSAT
ncbi:MAG: VanZ family protein [Ignavibacteriales bacterium]|nr:VanZ family protein [Ignavibacteriales bacterium]